MQNVMRRLRCVDWRPCEVYEVPSDILQRNPNRGNQTMTRLELIRAICKRSNENAQTPLQFN